jgi:hypothetical protein
MMRKRMKRVLGCLRAPAELRSPAPENHVGS